MIDGGPVSLGLESSSNGAPVTSATLIVLTTCDDAEQAQRLADGLVAERLAACVNRVDHVQSTYRWKGAVECDAESLLVIKTTEERYAALERAIKRISGYELPEVLAVRVHGGLADYLSWVQDSVAGASDP